jgi:hypothetical protein
MKATKILLIIFLTGIILGAFIAAAFRSDLFYAFTVWRSRGVMERGFPFIALNNIIVIALVLFGGVLFSLFEIKSFEKIPNRVYSLLDRMTFPLHRIYAIFDKRMLCMEKPMKSCYFISNTFPLMVLFFNAFLLANLLVYLQPMIGTTQDLDFIIAIAFTEFLCIAVAALQAYEFTRKNLILYEKNDTQEFRIEAWRFIYSRGNWIVLTILSIILTASAYLEYTLIE